MLIGSRHISLSPTIWNPHPPSSSCDDGNRERRLHFIWQEKTVGMRNNCVRNFRRSGFAQSKARRDREH